MRAHLLTTLLFVIPILTAACGGLVEEPAGSGRDESSGPSSSSKGGGSNPDSTAPPKGGGGTPPAQGSSKPIPSGALGSTVGAITLVRSGVDTRFNLHDGRTVSVILLGHDNTTKRSSFHYALLDASGKELESRQVAYGPQDMGGELEVHKTGGASGRALISIPESTRWVSSPMPTTATPTAVMGHTLLLNLGEEGHITIDGEHVQLKLTGFDPATGRNSFHYSAVATNGTILDDRDLAFGPQDIGSEIEVLKSSSQRALVTIPTSKYWLPEAQVLDTTRGSSILFQTSNEAASVTLPIGESLTYVGFSAPNNRSSFRYQAQNHANQMITMGPQDIGWEMEVLKVDATRSLTTLAVSDR